MAKERKYEGLYELARTGDLRTLKLALAEDEINRDDEFTDNIPNSLIVALENGHYKCATTLLNNQKYRDFLAAESVQIGDIIETCVGFADNHNISMSKRVKMVETLFSVKWVREALESEADLNPQSSLVLAAYRAGERAAKKETQKDEPSGHVTKLRTRSALLAKGEGRA